MSRIVGGHRRSEQNYKQQGEAAIPPNCVAKKTLDMIYSVIVNYNSVVEAHFS
jgi:hypothetical protein